MNEELGWFGFQQKLSSLEVEAPDLFSRYKLAQQHAKQNNIFTAQDMTSVLQNSQRLDLIQASGKQSHAGFRDELYLQVFAPLIDDFPAQDKGYWYFCVAAALKQLGIVEADTSYCMSKAFHSQGWPYDINFAVLLTQIYQANDSQSAVTQAAVVQEAVVQEASESDLIKNDAEHDGENQGVKQESVEQASVEKENVIKKAQDESYALHAFGVDIAEESLL